VSRSSGAASSRAMTTARRCDRIDDPARISDGLRVVVGLEGGQISDEVLVPDAQLVGQSLDQRVVEVNAAGQDQRQEEVHNGTGTVRIERGTAPK
jgi:hypothetical protein